MSFYNIGSYLCRTLALTQRSMSTKATPHGKAKEVFQRVERIVNGRLLFETQQYLDFYVGDMPAKLLFERVQGHPWVEKAYLTNGNLRVFVIRGAYPRLVRPELKGKHECDHLVSRQGEVHELPKSH